MSNIYYLIKILPEEKHLALPIVHVKPALKLRKIWLLLVNKYV